MALSVVYLPQKDFLEMVISGHYDMGETIDGFSTMLAICEAKGLRKVLLDYCQLAGLPMATERALFMMGVQGKYEEYLTSKGQALKVAFLADRSWQTETNPGMKISRAGGLPFELFHDDRAEALAWLGVAPQTGAEK